MVYEVEPIGIIRSPFKEKFGIPRQSGLVAEATGKLLFSTPYNRPEAVAGLEGYSHLWIQFLFHQALRETWQPTVRPPRLGGNRRVGVFASRSPFRPNPIGLSVVRLDGIEVDSGKVILNLSGIDLLDGTPVLDVKPYVPYVDSIPDARPGFAPEPPEAHFTVCFSPLAESQIMARPESDKLRALITRLLETDPRPAYAGSAQPDRVYGIRLFDFDLRWRISNELIEVLELG